MQRDVITFLSTSGLGASGPNALSFSAAVVSETGGTSADCLWYGRSWSYHPRCSDTFAAMHTSSKKCSRMWGITMVLQFLSPQHPPTLNPKP